MRKILLSILSGLLAVAVFSRIAIRYFDFLPMPWIWGLTALLTIIIIIKPSKQWICFAISFDLIVFGWQKLFHQQANVPQSVLDMPFSSLPADTVNWAYFQYSYPYMVAIALTQIICSFLLLFRKTRLLGLIMLLPVLLNIMMIDVFYQIGVGALLHATILFAGVIYLLAGYYNQLKQVFFQKNECNTYIVLAAAVLPFLLVATAPSTDKNPSITGKYNVENHALTTVYLEHFNDVTLQWGDVNHRYTGKYQYRGDTLIAGPLQGIIKKEMDHLTITGTLEKDSVHLDMIRL
ncbi:hypothetical protein [Chitinophaga sp. LS1]|uniref:hypothetical protein n=1 Tax=Chitinophaga sp. LS1 TaxID=3051176 RepID=UPI002AAB5AEA|nr:hypothetical protein [Chitinophaga sp. LS1]WPV65295.1 hypothetical protein QQL36_26165 [Chitinophaga sp. LS1]